ncbi:hypothetical protein F4604DRAFT_1152397 [Suillus subluteus]|nr:hypothetical protein F4604DRAFT_1152397 [Suillus subluteus]
MSTSDALTCLAFSPDGQKIASSTARSGVTIVNILSKSKRQVPTGNAYRRSYARRCYSISWSPDGEKIISALPDYTIPCWNATSTHPVGLPFGGHKDLILTAGIRPASSHAISLSRDGELLM